MGIWLTALQSVAAVHSAEHSLVHEHSHCLLCNFGNHQSAGPASIIPPTFALGLVSEITPPPYLQPSLPTLYRQEARAPPVIC